MQVAGRTRPAASDLDGAGRGNPIRYRVLAAVWLFQLINYIDRVALSFAGPDIMRTAGLTAQEFGIVLSSFGIGYIVAQVPGGLLADRFGAKVMVVVPPLFWALFTGMLGLATTVASFVVVRMLFGFAEGISNSACYKIVGDAFAPRDRARATAIWATSFALGPAFAGPLVGLLLADFGWRNLFFLLAVPPIFVALVNMRVLPRSMRAAVGGEFERDVTPAAARPRLGQLLRMPTLWIIAIGYVGFNVAFFGFLSWMPSFLAMQRGLDIKASGVLAGLPYMCALVGLPVVGWLGSGPLHLHRSRLLATLCFLGGMFLLPVILSNSLITTMVGLCGTALFLYAALSQIGTVILDHAPTGSNASYSGVITTVAQLGNIAAPALIGHLVTTTGSFTSGFACMMAGLLIGAVMMLILPRSRTGQGL